MLNPYKLSELISDFIRNEISPKDRALLEQWVQKDENNKQLLDRLRDPIALKDRLEYFDQLDVDYQWNKAQWSKRKTLIQYIRPYASYAALIAFLITSLFYINRNRQYIPHSNQEEFVQVEKDLPPPGEEAYLKLPNGEVINVEENDRPIFDFGGIQITNINGVLDYSHISGESKSFDIHRLTIPENGLYSMVLSDGTKVWLNASSELTFPVQFNNKIRTVKLTGEAYFEVMNDNAKPFIVETDQGFIEVLGTHFNVNSKDNNWSTVLIEGSVRITNKHGKKLLVPGEEARIVDKKILTSTANLKKVLAWKNKEFYFKNETMQEILGEVSQWYGFEINDKDLLGSKTFSGTIKSDLNLSEVLKILNALSGYKFYFDGKNLFVKK